MRSITHAICAVAATSIFLGSDPALLVTGVLASVLPNVDSSKSIPGKIFLSLSRWIEKRYPYRTITHSFLATGAIAFLLSPITLLNVGVWKATVLGYFCGWFADVFTKSGVAAFYPLAARLVIPENPNLRLSTDSKSEYFVMAVLVLVAIASISINSSGGIVRSFNQTLGIPSGAVEIASAEGSQYLLFASINGRAAITQQPIQDDFEIIRALTQNDLLVKDREGKVYRVGTSEECQIIANRITIKRDRPIRSRVQEIQLDDQLLFEVLPKFPSDSKRTYINGTLTLADAEDLVIATHSDRFDTITGQPGEKTTIVRLESAGTAEATKLLTDYYATGSLIIRSQEVL